ncbi:hypothetical protein B0I72DRAFT_158322 [Yarrowia lipolytica]|nr:hypothetical protein BKA91DRAFT_163181 [Yarrowia lipolytica]KAE8172586.1 hypothetical protein BKA90DRAFT_157224 [Yarrowia lipolytica]KAJ8054053.1 hypothetical protein LXG23DRAFT_48399 [Yarrowia lipolytica]RDW33050.1 hypothetical protein B0I72DRAFT_158322 [Yarrowia lipolytica]RDW38283.1 hypothetical protein B0I73DRAFT_160374 [Yarrowia lipolytica]
MYAQSIELVVLLRHLAFFSPKLDPTSLPSEEDADIRKFLKSQSPDTSTCLLSELPEFISGAKRLAVPVYTIWGSSEDVRVVEKFASSELHVPNLHIVGLASDTPCPLITCPGGLKIRLLGLGGAFIVPKLLDHGASMTSSIGGMVGATWSTLLGVGELLCNVRDTYAVDEIRVFLCHNSPLKEELLCHLAHTLRADYVICGGLHFFYGLSFNHFAVTPSFETYVSALGQRSAAFAAVWQRLRHSNDLTSLTPQKLELLDLAANIFLTVPRLKDEEINGNGLVKLNHAENEALRNTTAVLFQRLWYFNLPDMTHGNLVLSWKNGRLGSEMSSEGFDLSNRKRGAGNAPRGGWKERERDPVLKNTPTGPAEPGSASSKDHIVEGPGVWVPVGGSEDLIRGFFPPEHRANITQVVIKMKSMKGSKPFSMIFFDTEEQADAALAAIDAAAGSASRIKKERKGRPRPGRGGRG